MEDSWIYIDDDDSQHSASDSDIIDSETEAELYSTIHYEESLNSSNFENANFLSSDKLVQGNNFTISSPNKNVFCTVDKKEYINTHLNDTLKSVSNDLHSVEKNKTSPDHNFSDNEIELHLNPLKKVKFDSVKETDNIELCSINSENRDVNELSKNTSLNLAQNSLQFNNANDSSDSDNILREGTNDSSKQTNFEINLLKDVDTIYLSSSSDSDSELPVSPSTKRDSFLKNLSMPNIKIGEPCKGLWQINDEDLYRQKKYTRRYHENIDIKCSSCNEKGHNFRSCPKPKKVVCYICGGAHAASRCMNRMCSNCYSFGHDRKRCRMRPNGFYCTLCRIRGHIKENCPDLWRRYHLTTKPKKIIQGKKVKQDRNLYCWNCGDHGHFGAVCKSRYSRNLTTWPCVVSYDDPHELLRKRLNDEKNMSYLPRFEPLKNSLNSPSKNKDAVKAAKTARENQRRKRRQEKKKMKMQMRCIKELIGEHDFPRTPKEISKQEDPNGSEMPESVELASKRKMKKKMKKKQKMKRQGQSGVNRQNLQVVM